jgi:hypothetical protein
MTTGHNGGGCGSGHRGLRRCAREAVKALIVATHFLEIDLEKLRAMRDGRSVVG